MRDCLLELGYPVGNVRYVFDGTRDQIVDSFREFYPMVRASPRPTVLVFLAGHGLESGAENGFLGVDCVDVASVEGAGACWFPPCCHGHVLTDGRLAKRCDVNVRVYEW
jgi:hypothetical protein